ncbi:hypothetical protein Q5P01_025123 [Channa striata]|uniref:Uncharacterized protein n=1 Tax=Channa striata TaxID=64152 RepID=A0AA88LPE2_CHASR|nr:hypothetical protein Q5P01_025123 [Channa striata]
MMCTIEHNCKRRLQMYGSGLCRSQSPVLSSSWSFLLFPCICSGYPELLMVCELEWLSNHRQPKIQVFTSTDFV